MGDFRRRLTEATGSLICMDAPVIRAVVDDDHLVHRDGTRQILAPYADLHVVGDANSGEDTLEVINRLRPDVMLMDIRLPGMNGIEVTRRLTRDHPGVCVLMWAGTTRTSTSAVPLRLGLPDT